MQCPEPPSLLPLPQSNKLPGEIKEWHSSARIVLPNLDGVALLIRDPPCCNSINPAHFTQRHGVLSCQALTNQNNEIYILLFFVYYLFKIFIAYQMQNCIYLLLIHFPFGLYIWVDNWFSFHPLKLISNNYWCPSKLMKIWNEELAKVVSHFLVFKVYVREAQLFGCACLKHNCSLLVAHAQNSLFFVAVFGLL